MKENVLERMERIQEVPEPHGRLMTNAMRFAEVFGKDALDILELNIELDIWLDQPYKEPEVTRRENP